jgi:hypothetical protein
MSVSQDAARLRAALARDEARARMRDAVLSAVAEALLDDVDLGDIIREFGVVSGNIVRAFGL